MIKMTRLASFMVIQSNVHQPNNTLFGLNRIQKPGFQSSSCDRLYSCARRCICVFHLKLIIFKKYALFIMLGAKEFATFVI